MAFARPDIEKLCNILRDAAASEILPRFRRLAEDGIRQKTSPLDLVTDADEKAEWQIAEAVARTFPGALFVGEESTARDPGLLTKIGAADLAIVVDPVDGTANFAWGLPLFGMIAAVVRRGETIAGVIYDPIGKDHYLAIRGEGAWVEDASGHVADLEVAGPAPLAAMTGVASWHYMPEPQRSRVAANLARVKAPFAYRCCAHEYRLLARGQVHFGLYWKLMPWDHAAGLLLHAEAGGFSACLDGSPYAPTRHAGGILSAPDRDSWLALRQALLD